MTEHLTVVMNSSYGPCERCYDRARQELVNRGGSRYDNLPIEIYLDLPEATKRYRWPCLDEYLCVDCASTVEKPQYVKDLSDD